MLISMVITSGRNDSASATASRPSRACPATSSCGSALMISLRTLHMYAESSTTSTRSFLSALFVISILPHRRKNVSALFGCFHQARHRGNQLIFLYRLRQESRRPFFQRAFAVLGSCARCNHQDGNPAGGWGLPKMREQFIAIHSRHFEVGDDQVASHLRYDFRGFKTIGRELHAIASLFQHPAHEFADADGIVGNYYNAIVSHGVHSLRGNATSRNGFSARRENSCGRR